MLFIIAFFFKIVFIIYRIYAFKILVNIKDINIMNTRVLRFGFVFRLNYKVKI